MGTNSNMMEEAVLKHGLAANESSTSENRQTSLTASPIVE
jgi:hypothetical protein